jgi:TolB-like protein
VLLAGERVVVTDFGLARAQVVLGGSGRDPATTAAGAVIGTFTHAAPEQLQGLPLTPAADVHALGVVLYELVTGGLLPFAGRSAMETAERRLRDEAPSPRRLVPDLDPRWEAVILRCLERDPADRFARARDVQHALAGDRVTAARGGHARHRRRLVLLAGAAALAVALLGAWALERRARRDASAPPPRSDLVPAAVKPRRAVAVLGFKNLSGNEEAAWLSTAFSEMLGSELAAGEALRIVAGETVARMKLELALKEADALASDTLARVRRHLGADLLVMGSYAMLGGKIRLDLRL